VPADAEPATGTAARRARQEADRQTARSGPARPGVAQPPARRGTTTARPTAEPGDGDATRPDPALSADRLAALEEQRDFLLGSLDDLEREHDAGDVDDVDYQALKDDYTARAAAVIRSIENRHARTRRRAAAHRPRARGRSLVIGAVVVAVALGLGVFVAQSSGTRSAGQGISGDIRQSSRDQLLTARQQMAQNQYADAIHTYDQVLATVPDDPEALAYKGWLLRLTAQQASSSADRTLLLAQARDSLDKAIAADPNYPDARVFRAVLLRDLGQDQAALDDLNHVKPDGIPSFMSGLVDQLRSSLNAGPGGTTPGTTAP
jgi:tetratricopeptide (TPR) repeat protein